MTGTSGNTQIEEKWATQELEADVESKLVFMPDNNETADARFIGLPSWVTGLKKTGRGQYEAVANPPAGASDAEITIESLNDQGEVIGITYLTLKVK